MSDTLDTGPEPVEDGDTAADELVASFELSPEEEAEMTEALRARFGLEETSTAEEEQPDEPTAEPESAIVAEEELEEAPPPPPAPPPDPFAEIPDEDKRSLVGLRNWLTQNPEKAQEVQRVISGQTPEPEPVAPPEWVDQDDPAQMALWNHLQKIESEVAKTAQNQRVIAETQAKAKGLAAIQDAMNSFRTEHPELSDTDVDTVRLHAVSLNIIGGLEASFGGPNTPGSGEKAVRKALDMAYWDHPEFRARASAEPTVAQVKATAAKERKAKLGALSGTSGSAPRTETRPDLSTDKAARSAAIDWLEQSGVLGPPK